MKQLCLLFAVAITLSAWAPLGRIHFRGGDLKTNLKLAEKEQKLLFIDLTAHWCHSCKLMEETTFRSPEIVEMLNKNYIAIKIDADRIDGKLLAAQENVKVLPALIVMDAQGNRVDMINHAPSTEKLQQMLKSSLTTQTKQRSARRSSLRRG